MLIPMRFLPFFRFIMGICTKSKKQIRTLFSTKFFNRINILTFCCVGWRNKDLVYKGSVGKKESKGLKREN